jgi:hypothetical protein
MDDRPHELVWLRLGRAAFSVLWLLWAQRTQRGGAAMENSRFKIQDPSFRKDLPEKQQITILYYGEDRLGCGCAALCNQLRI